jgi:dienelactone hydrolase
MIDGADHGEISPYESAKSEDFLKTWASTAVSVAEKKEPSGCSPVTAFVGNGVSAGKAYEKYASEDAEIFSFENLRYFTRNNLNYVKGEIKGIVMEFPGLGGSSCLGGLVNMGEYKTEFALSCAEQGILVMYMYCGPWSWGNKGVVRIADLVIDALIKHYGLPADIPVVSTGGSMGGLGTFMFTEGSRHNVVGCMAACPCYDIIGKYTSYSSNPNFPRTFISAIYNYDMSLSDGLKAITPCEHIDTMPKVPYYIVCNVEDECFDDEGMQVFADDMRAIGHDVTIKVLPNTKHGEFTDEERVSYRSFILDRILKK